MAALFTLWHASSLADIELAEIRTCVDDSADGRSETGNEKVFRAARPGIDHFLRLLFRDLRTRCRFRRGDSVRSLDATCGACRHAPHSRAKAADFAGRLARSLRRSPHFRS